MNVTNLTQDGNHSKTQRPYCVTSVNGIHHQIFLAALNVPLSISAFIGNLLILVALKKASNLRSSSKLWLGCLATTDLCVGLVSQPIYVALKMSTEHSKQCFYLMTLYNITSCIFVGVSLLTLTAISVDRLLALLMGLRYRRHEVSLKRVWMFVISFWLYSTIIALQHLYDFRFAIYLIIATLLICFSTSTFCYTNIYFRLRRHQSHLHEHFHQGQRGEIRTSLNIARYKKTVSGALWIQMALVTCYLPYIIVIAIFIIVGFRTPSLNFAWSVAITLYLFNSSLNPILYCWKIKAVRLAVKDTLSQLRNLLVGCYVDRKKYNVSQ